MAEPVRADRPGDQPTRVLVEKWIAGAATAYGITGQEMAAFVGAVANDVAGLLTNKDDETDRWRSAWRRSDREWAQDRALGQWLVAEARAQVVALGRQLESADQGLAEMSELASRHLGWVKSLVRATLGHWDDGASHKNQVAAASMRIERLVADAPIDLGWMSLPQELQDAAVNASRPAARVWQKGDPEPPADVCALRDTDHGGRSDLLPFLVRGHVSGWVWAASAHPETVPVEGSAWSSAVAYATGPLTEVIPQVPSGGETDG